MIYGGNGIATFDGVKVFVPFSAPHDYVQLCVTERKSKYYVAAITDIIQPSPMRVKPACSYFTECGGCDLQHINYQSQLEIKQHFVLESLNRIGHINLKNPPPTIPSKPFHYRNKTQYPLVGHPIKIGFFRQMSHHVIDIQKCLLHPPIFDQLRSIIKEQIIKTQEPIYNEIRHVGNLRHIIIRQGMYTNQLLIIFVTTTAHLNQNVFKHLTRSFPNIVGITQNINPDRTNRILGNKNRILFGNDFYYEKLLDKQFKISTKAFFQVNTEQAQNLVKKLREYIYPAEQVLDLYCGVGVLAIMISDLVKKVYGVEISQDAIQDAYENIKINKIDNIEFTAAPAELAINRFRKIDTVIIDPPRKGCSENLLNNITRHKPKKIIYISCNPTTFARDMAFLQTKHYQLEKYELIDMFAQTFHVEAIAKIIRQ